MANYSTEIQSSFPLVENLTFIPAGPSSSEDRTFYRIWFSMLKHPDFPRSSINSLEPDVYSYWSRWLTIVYNELS